MEKTFYTHKFRDNKSRRLTIAGVIQGNIMSFGYATCSRKDQFAKFRGRLIAEGRAIKTPTRLRNIENDLQIGKTFYTIAKEIAEQV